MRRRLSSTHRTSRVVAVAATIAIALTILPFHFAQAGAVQALAPVTEADGSLGLCNVLPGNAPGPNGLPWAQLAYNAGARMNRWEIRWDRIEAQPDHWNFTTDDAAVQSSQKYDLDVLGILIGTPGWAAAAGQRPGNGRPRGLYQPYTDPRNLWADYVRQTVSHYRGQVRAWEIWNEPDLSFFWTSGPDDYFRLLRVSYLVIKDTDPSAQVLMAGMVVPDLAFLGHVLDDARHAAGSRQHHGYFDVVAWHAYGPAKALYRNILRVKQLLAGKGYRSAPMWVTEDGFPAANPNGEPRQAAYVLQTVTYALTAGANRVLVYRASDDATPKQWGVVSAAGAPRMGYVAFQVAARFLSHLQAISYSPTAHLERFVFYEPNRRVTLLWNRGLQNRDTDLAADSLPANIIDWMGNVTSRGAVGGQLHLTVPGASYNSGTDRTGSVVGGPAVLIQQLNRPPSSIGSSLYVSPLPGTQRRFVVLNPSDEAASIQLAAARSPAQRMTFQLDGHAMLQVDLDLLAGNSYRDMYVISASGPVVGEAVSNQGVVPGAEPARTWYVSAAAEGLNIGNGSDKQVAVHITAFGAKGRVQARQTLQLAPASQGTWQLPSWLWGKQLALMVHSTGPVILNGSSAVPASSSTWYALRPGPTHLSVFNPDAATATHVDVRFVGSHTVKGVQLRLAPHESFVFPSHRARAVVLSAAHPVAVGYADPAGATGPLLDQPDTRAAVAAAGSTTRVAVFNPSQQTAHVTLSLVNAGSTNQKAIDLAPSQMYTLRARQPLAPARGVVVSSDIPVVAGPAS